MASGICELSGRYYPSLDSHHTIPVEFGGKDSLQVLLGPDVHQTLHRCVNNPKLQDEFLSSLPPLGRQKAQVLISLILKAAQTNSKATRLGRGELVEVKIHVSASMYARLKAMQEELGKRSVPQVIQDVLEAVIKK